MRPSLNAERFLLAAAMSLVACAVARSGEESGDGSYGARPAEPAPRFVVEYLPPLVYRDRESVHLKFRIENPGKTEAACTVEAALVAGGESDEAPEAPAPVMLQVPAGGKRSGGFTLPSSGWARAEFELSSGGARSTALVIRRFGEEDEVPALEARGERLQVKDSCGASARAEAAVVVLRQRMSFDDREWIVMKLLAEQLSEGTVPAGVTLLAPAFRGAKPEGKAGPEGKAEPPDYFRTVREGAGTWVEATALPGEAARGVTNPILADFATVLAALDGSRPAGLVIMVVACDDARRATPARTFRKAVDFLMVRARRRSGRVAVLFVPEPAVLKARREIYAEELRRSASAFMASYSRVHALEDADCWRPGGASRSKGALARYPNSKGRAALAEAILDRIRP